MNISYRLLWNDATGTWVAAAEFVRARGKRAGTVRRLVAALAFGGAAAVALAEPPAAQQLPTGGQIVGGAAAGSIASQGNTMTITQHASHLIANWDSFSIGANASVNFVQPSASAIALNRVVGQAPSQILGQLNANGRVVLVNPAGIVFGQGSQVNVGALVASSLALSDADFLAGKLSFTASPAAGAVRNEGHIATPEGGVVAFLAPVVGNGGRIDTPKGSTLLAAADGLDIDFAGDGLISYRVTAATARALVENSGSIVADGGMAVLSASAVDDVARTVINDTGLVRARTLAQREGRILLLAEEAKGAVDVAGALDASAAESGKGGAIGISGGSVNVAAGARLDASGALGGGSVQIGGGPRGSGVLPHARTVALAADAVVDADARLAGDGGEISVWATGHAEVAGRFSARGAGGGAGGLVETSGHTVDFTGIRVDTAAPSGRSGTWLVDPENLTVGSGDAATIAANLATTNVSLQTTATTASGPGATSSGLGDITIDAAIAWSSGHTLTLDAYNAIRINAPITVAGTGTLALTAAYDPAYTQQLRLSFGSGGRVRFTAPSGSGQALSINGQGYSLIYTIADLQAINTNGTTLAGKYALADALDATGVAWTSIGTDGAGTPKVNGDPVPGFRGMFDGMGNTVANLTVAAANGSAQYTGLFGLTSGAELRNLGLINPTVTGNTYTGALIGRGASTGISNVYVSGGSVTGNTANSNGVGGMVGYLNTASGGVASSIFNAYATAAVSGQNSVGGLIGTAGSVRLANAYATGNVTGSGLAIGGLVGSASFSATVVNSHATGSVTGSGASSDSVGGLVGNLNNSAAITDSYATGAVSGAQNVGGLVGQAASGASIAKSYATGNVSASAATSVVGGLVGLGGNGSGPATLFTVTESFATGAVVGNDQVGGLIGYSGYGRIDNSYALGPVRGGNYIGGLFGFARGSAIDHVFAAGAVSGSGIFVAGLAGGASGAAPNTVGSSVFWNTATTGRSAGAVSSLDNLPVASFGSGKTTAALQADLASLGFSAATWGIVGGTSYPYLLSRYGTAPQVISGTAYKDGGGTVLASGGAGEAWIRGLIDGSAIGQVATGANGYYYFLLPGGSIVGGGAQVLTYAAADAATGAVNAASLGAGATGSVAALDLWGDWLRTSTPSTSLSSLNALLNTAIGGNGSVGTLIAGLGSQRIAALGGSFDFDGSLSRSRQIAIDSGGTVTQSAGTLAADTLLLTGAGGAYTLNRANTVAKLAATTGSLDFNNAAALQIAVAAPVSGVATTGTVSIRAAGNLGIASGAAVSGANPVLGSAGVFTNDAGANAVTATTGRWLVYLPTPTGSSFGNLDSQHAAIWNTASLGAVTAGGNRYVFAEQPSLTFTSSSLSKDYGSDATAALAAGYTVAGLRSVAGAFADSLAESVSGSPAVSSAGAGAGANAGSYPVLVATGSLAAQTGYLLAYASTGSLAVNPLSVTVAADDKTRIYGSADPALSFTVVSGALLNGDRITGSLVRDSGENAGVYAIRQGSLSAGSNYVLSFGNGSFTITPAALTVAANGLDKVYDGQAFIGGNGVSYAGFVAGDGPSSLQGQLTYAGSAQGAKNAGSYLVVPEGLSSGNYRITYSSGIVTIRPAAVTVAADDKTRIYGSADPALSFTVVSGALLNGDRITGSLVRDTGENVGVYAIRQGSLSAGSNYALSFGNGSFTITPAALAVAANGLDKVYDGQAFSGGNGVSYSGFVAGDGPSSLQGQLTYAGSAQGAKNAGSYLVVPEGLSSGNYRITYSNGIVTIRPAPIIAVATAADKDYDGTTAATLGSLGLTGTVAGETLRVAYGSAEFGDALPGAGKTVTVSGIRIADGTGLAANYALQADRVIAGAAIKAVTSPQPVLPAPLPTPAAPASPNPGQAAPLVAEIGNAGSSLGDQAVRFDFGGERLSLVLGDASLGSAPSESGSGLRLFVRSGDGTREVGTLAVSEQNRTLTASLGGATGAAGPAVDVERLSFVAAGYDPGNGTSVQVSVALSPDGALVLRIPASLKAGQDDRQLALVGLALARSRLGARVADIANVLVLVRD